MSDLFDDLDQEVADGEQADDVKGLGEEIAERIGVSAQAARPSNAAQTSFRHRRSPIFRQSPLRHAGPV